MTVLNNISRLKETRQKLRNGATEVEKIFWKELQGKKILGLKFRRQHSVGRYILDFYCPKLKLGIELDGSVHDNREEYDNIRTEFLNNCDLDILRFSNNDIEKNLEKSLNNLTNYITKKYDK
ncbi:MAG: DUF559 domain-containing protein [Candidatus Gracilibacteria bacterium]|nr:DUF559 domain-containing protein [Candidatus Gracilibacteria bacterium]MDQ7022874.1 DUF559 domain-containing protein [Candidatus Gracilibacteria bacterium]